MYKKIVHRSSRHGPVTPATRDRIVITRRKSLNEKDRHSKRMLFFIYLVRVPFFQYLQGDTPTRVNIFAGCYFHFIRGIRVHKWRSVGIVVGQPYNYRDVEVFTLKENTICSASQVSWLFGQSNSNYLPHKMKEHAYVQKDVGNIIQGITCFVRTVEVCTNKNDL